MAQIKPLHFATTAFKAPECCRNCPFFLKGNYGGIFCKHPDGPVVDHDYEQQVHKECPLQFVEVKPQFVKPDESKTILDTEGFEPTKGSRKYEDAIIVGAYLMKTNEEALKQLLRNYDRLVKEKNGSENLELPYWCYDFCRDDES